MAEEKFPPISEDHPIREIWKINGLDIAGYIKLAEDGDIDAAKYLMQLYVRREIRTIEDELTGFTPIYSSDDLIWIAQLKRYILTALTDSYRTENATKAFNLQKPKNRPNATYKEKLNHCRVGYLVARYIDDYRSVNKACEDVANEMNISKSKALHYYRKYMLLSKK
jgi:hypothetical protein